MKIFAPDKQQLLENIQRSGNRELAIELGREMVHPPTWTKHPDAHCLRIDLRDAKSFLFPYSDLAFGQMETENGSEKLILTFSGHEVWIFGRQLAELFTALQKYSVGRICELPTRYEPLQGRGALQISKIEVRAIESSA